MRIITSIFLLISSVAFVTFADDDNQPSRSASGGYVEQNR